MLGMRQFTRAAGPSRVVAFKEGDAVVVDTKKVKKLMDPPPIALRATSTESS